MNDDRKLLKGFVCEGSQVDFEALVQRYTPMVFSSAQRRVGAACAEDITQAVFIILAEKAARLYKRQHGNVAGWLHTTTRYAALQSLRSEKRRVAHELEATEEQETLQEQAAPETWTLITPLLDKALDSLNGKDRNAILLRFFKGASHAEIGQALGISENSANKRVERALTKLKHFFKRRDITVSAITLTAAIAGEGTATAATGLSASCVAAALSTGSAGILESISNLVSHTTTAMLVAQAKTITLTGATCAALLGSAAIGIQHQITPKPPNVRLLRVERFAIAYKGRTELPDGTFEFQLNDSNSHQTHFVKIGDHVLGYEVKEHTLKTKPIRLGRLNDMLAGDVSELTLESPGHRIVLMKDKYIPSDKWMAVVRVADEPATRQVGNGCMLNDHRATYNIIGVNPRTQTITLRSQRDGKTFTISIEGNKNNR